MIFRLKADVVFEAEHIEDALKRLGMHFMSIVLDDPSSALKFRGGDIEVEPYVPDGTYPYVDEEEAVKRRDED